jgi:exoribonuclease R
VKPMLPEQYSEKVCSLLPGKKSYGVSLEIVWNTVGKKIEGLQWYESEFENNCSYTYDEFQESDCKWKSVLQEFTSYLAGEAVTDSHKWIEECMKFYNIEAAKLLKESGMGILRRHSSPKMELLESLKEIPELKFLAYESAEYCLASDNSTQHYGLSTDTYTHITSPIRRYADLMNQRILKMILGKKGEYIVPISMIDMNFRQKQQKRFYRDVELLNAIKDNSEFTAVIVQKYVKNDKLHLKLFVKEWNKIINARYNYLDENTIITPDEKRTIPVELFSTLHIKCVYMYNTRSWKDRILFEIKDT